MIKGAEGFWGEVARLLQSVNAGLSVFEGRKRYDKDAGPTPSLLIVSAGALSSAGPLPANVPVLVLTGGEAGQKMPRGFFHLKWPEEKDSFLETTSRLLYVSGRKLFRTAISIRRKGNDETFMGKSVNFSRTGMAFRTAKKLDEGDLIEIGFFIPNSDDEVVVEAEVMRVSADPADGSVYYGAKFRGSSKDLLDAFEAFIGKDR